jgi:trehalose 6-phosphate phosphatase
VTGGAPPSAEPPGAGPPSPGPGSLPEPATAAGRDGLATLLASPRSALVGLDFDGTLSPIVSDPAKAVAHPEAAGALRRLAPLVGTVAVITGRPAADAVELGGFADVPGLLILGQYGLQRWESGRLETPPPPPGVQQARSELPDLLERAGALPGTWVEDKKLALAVHTRRTADPEEALARVRGPLADLAQRADLAVEPGRMVIELRPHGTDKGGALSGLVAQRDARAVLFCGDDLGDLAAFAAVRELRAAGTPGVTVYSRSAGEAVAEMERQADLSVDGPGGVVALLDALADAIARRGPEA